jgi:hypothetical protein
MLAEERDKSTHHPEYTKVVDVDDFLVDVERLHFDLTGTRDTGVVDKGARD